MSKHPYDIAGSSAVSIDSVPIDRKKLEAVLRDIHDRLSALGASPGGALVEEVERIEEERLREEVEIANRPRHPGIFG